mmetsp:Transcript_63304/g.125184  ORF Transcript_63304/g.125184 Transcript_63304/m.125184 type:complete len:243 (-) Transcript_63304:767-1495(-)
MLEAGKLPPINLVPLWQQLLQQLVRNAGGQKVRHHHAISSTNATQSSPELRPHRVALTHWSKWKAFQEVVAVHQLHVRLQALKSLLVKLRVRGGTTIFQKQHLIAEMEGINGCGLDAHVGDQSTHDNPLHSPGLEHLLQGSFCERGVPALFEHHIRVMDHGLHVLMNLGTKTSACTAWVSAFVRVSMEVVVRRQVASLSANGLWRWQPLGTPATVHRTHPDDKTSTSPQISGHSPNTWKNYP